MTESKKIRNLERVHEGCQLLTANDKLSPKDCQYDDKQKDYLESKITDLLFYFLGGN